MNWVIMPVLDNLEQSIQALSDACNQSIPTKVLVINQGSSNETRRRLEALAEEHDQQILLWSFDPALPSLSAVWNRALDFVWELGGTEALVINNDIRLDTDTYQTLLNGLRYCLGPEYTLVENLFVSAVGVTAEQFEERRRHDEHILYTGDRGGPDFSCFLISKACHQQFRFDEGFIPAFCEDLDFHRRVMLGGLGDQIFSINLPFAHLGSQTLKTMDPKKREAVERQISGISRKHYREKWGGEVNQETYWSAYDNKEGEILEGTPLYQASGPTTPELQAYVSTVRTSIPSQPEF